MLNELENEFCLSFKQELKIWVKEIGLKRYYSMDAELELKPQILVKSIKKNYIHLCKTKYIKDIFS